MAPPTDRREILQGLRDQIAKGQAVVGGGAGVGLSAKFAEAGGYEGSFFFFWQSLNVVRNLADVLGHSLDMIIIYNSGRFRMAGHGSLAGLLPYGNANGLWDCVAGDWVIHC